MRWSCSAPTARTPTRHPAADRFALGAGRDQPQHQVPEQVLLIGSDAGVDRLGRPGDSPTNATGLGVPRHRQRRALPALPGLEQGVGQERQRTRRPLHLADEQVHQARLDEQSGLPGRRLDRLAQGHLAHATQQVQTTFHEPGEARGTPTPGRAGPRAVRRPRSRDPGTTRPGRSGTPRVRPRPRTARTPPRTGRRPALPRTVGPALRPATPAGGRRG